MKAFVMTDLEGVAGVVSFEEQTRPDTRYGEQAKRLLTAEVNSCVQGLREAGVTDVVVLDGHGDGGIVYEEIHPEARLIHGKPLAEEWRNQMEGMDVAVIVGQHAMAGVPDGNLNHTQDSRSITYFTLNGRLIGETAQFALFAGSYGVPLIFLSGDEAACREAQELIPGVTTAAVKKGLGRNSAVSVSAPRSRELIRAGAAAAVARQRTSPLKPLVWPGPYVLEKRFFGTNHLEQYRYLATVNPNITMVDPLTVRIRGDDIRALIYA
ncbi:MAG TPA: M55 family metallopeptidase [Spirochaetia bacterium]|nr:M55 family metallopeptidase [Spirochaetia bacterium]